MNPVVDARHLRKTFLRGAQHVHALDDVSLAVSRRELVTIVGPSGSGKSTLLQVIGGLQRSTAGSVRFENDELSDLTDDALARLRRRRVGFVFQFFHVMPSMTVLDNAVLPVMLHGRVDRIDRGRARDLLGYVGLGHRMEHTARELSDDEKQRVAIARALIARPGLLVADDPTGNLEPRSGALVLELIARLAEDMDLAIVMATHDPGAARFGTRVLRMFDGRLTNGEVGPDRHSGTRQIHDDIA